MIILHSTTGLTLAVNLQHFVHNSVVTFDDHVYIFVLLSVLLFSDTMCNKRVCFLAGVGEKEQSAFQNRSFVWPALRTAIAAPRRRHSSAVGGEDYLPVYNKCRCRGGTLSLEGECVSSGTHR